MRIQFAASLTRGALGLALVLPLTTSGCWFVAAGGVAAAGGGGGGGGGVVNLAPSATLADPGRLDQPEEQLTFTVADGNNDLVDLDVSFQLQGSGVTPATLISAQVVAPPAISTTATVAPAIISIVDNVVTGIPATAAGVEVVVTWALGSDVNLNVASPGPSLIFGVTDGKVTVAPVVQQDDGTIIGNDAPVVSNVQVSGNSGNIVVSFQVLDSTTDDVDVVLLFSNDDFATITTATNLVGSTEGLATVSTGVIIHTFSWISDKDDLPLQNSDDLELRIVATDATASSSADSAAFDLVNNLPPQVNIIELESRDPGNANGNIPFKLFISNPEEEEDLVLAFQFQVAIGGTIASLQSATIITPSPPSATTNGFSIPFSSDANGEVFNLRWDADGDLGGSTAQPNTRLTITIADQLGQGNTITSQVLSVLNDAPVVTFATDTTGQTTIESPQSGDVQIPILIVDSSADDVDVRVEFSITGDFSDVQSATLVGTDPNLALTSTPGGVQNTLVWASETDLDKLSDEVTIRLVGRDAFSAIGLAATTVITILNNDNPNVDIDDVVRQDGAVTIFYTLTDKQSDPVDLEVVFRSADGSQTGTATEFLGFGDGITNVPSAPGGVLRSFVWNSQLDIGTGALQDITISITPSDDQGTGLSKASNTFIVGNDAPEILKFQAITDEQSGNVAIQFTLTDSTADSAEMILAEFSVDDFATATSATLVGGNPNALATSIAGAEHTVVWVSNDPGQLAGIDSSVKMRFQFEDVGVPGAEQSLVFTTGSFSVDNNDPPRVIVTEPVINPDGNGNTVLEFTVFDDESDLVDVVLQWQVSDEVVPTLGAEFDTQASRLTSLADANTRATLQIPSELDRPFIGVSQQPSAPLAPGQIQTPSILLSASLSDTELLNNKAIAVRRPVRPTTAATLNNPGAVVAEIDVQGNPTGSALVGLRSNGELVSIDLEAGAVTSVATGLGTPSDIALTADGRLALVIDDTGDRLIQVNLTDGTTNVILSGLTTPFGVALQNAATALVSDAGTGEVLRVDLASGTSTIIAQNLNEPSGLVLSKDGQQLFIAERGAQQIVALDLTRHLVTRVTDASRGLATRPQGLTLRRDGRSLLVANDDGATSVVAQVNLSTSRVGTVFDSINLTDITNLVGISEARDGTLLLALNQTGASLLVSGGTEALGTVTAVATGPRPLLTTDLANPPITAARQLVVLRGLNPTVLERDATLSLESSPTGVTHRFSWDTVADSVPNFTIQVAATPFDRDRGQATISQVPQVRRYIEDAPSTVVEDSIFSPDTFEAADLNDDGLVDLVVPSSDSSSRICIYLRNAGGDFPATPSHKLTGITKPTGLAIADMDGDGLLDIVSANNTGDNVTIFRQTASGVFDLTPSVTLTDVALDDPQTVSVGDMDGDGDLDLVTANQGSANNATLFRQDTSSPLTFSLAQTFSSAALDKPEQALLADADGDGDLDVAVGDQSMAPIEVFRQTSPGAFEATASISVSAAGGSATGGAFDILDIDGDGLTDIVAKRVDIGAFFATAPGVFGSQVVIGAGEASGNSTTLADLDGDGDLDIVDGGLSDGLIRVTRQTAPRVFESSPSAVLVGGQFITAVRVADMDGDGDSDLVSSSRGDGTVSIFRQTSTHPFDPAPTEFIATGNKALSVAGVGPLDSDDLLDLATLGLPGNILSQESPGVFASDAFASLSGISISSEGTVADLDGDGDHDVVSVSQFVVNSVAIFFQTSSGVFSLTELADGTADCFSVALGDVDGDGLLDIATADLDANRVSIYRQTSPGTFEDPAGVVLTDAGLLKARCVRMADLDADGDPDLVVAGEDSDSILVFLNNAGTFTANAPLTNASLESPQQVALSDVDNDGDLDIISINNLLVGNDNITIFQQTTPGQFSSTPIVITPPGNDIAFPQRLVTGDMDGDGDDDIVVAARDAVHVVVFRQLGPGIFEDSVFTDLPLGGGESTLQTSVADMDGDGRLEIISGSSGNDTISIFSVTGNP